MGAKAKRAVGVDIGGTGIKAGIVDLDAGVLASDRVKVATPAGAEPIDVLLAVRTVLDALGVADDHDVHLGVAFPAIVKDGRTLSAANVSDKWIGFEAEKFFEDGLGRGIHFANDADVAGVAEVRYGAAKGHSGLVILTTLGTGIGSAMIYEGVLVGRGRSPRIIACIILRPRSRPVPENLRRVGGLLRSVEGSCPINRRRLEALLDLSGSQVVPVLLAVTGHGASLGPPRSY